MAPIKLLAVTVVFLFTAIIFSGCEKTEATAPSIERGSMSDIEGNVYPTVKIGNQWWMAENLRVKKFRDGTSIKEAQDQGWGDTVPSFCMYDHNANAPGLLYNWYAANKEIAPAGWHIATDAEWKELEKYLGMTDAEASKNGWRGNEAIKLKVTGTSGWTGSEGQWPTNESGFSALAGSCRLPSGVWGDPGLFATGFWWSSTKNAHGDEAYYRYMDYKKASIFRATCEFKYGFSVRCVRD
jgi:uncharacterized protein (TIGR02145 family)